MKQKHLCILVTGAGAPGIRGTLYCLRNNPDHIPVRIVGTDVRDEVVGKYLVEKFHRFPPPEDPSYIETLTNVCASESVDLVIPQTTREIAVLSQYRDMLAERKIPVMVANANAISIANNKYEIIRFFEKYGLPSIDFQLANNKEELVRAAEALGYPDQPVVVKPPVSNGMRGFRVLCINAWNMKRFLAEKPSGIEISLDELLSILSRGESWPELLVTEYLPGIEYSVDAFIGSHGCVAIPRLRKAIRSGISFETIIENHKIIKDYTIKAGQSMGLQYAYGFQFKLDKCGLPKVLECNPRVQGTMVASCFGGVNIIWLAVREAIGDPVKCIPDSFVPAIFLRYWGGVGICGDEIVEI